MPKKRKTATDHGKDAHARTSLPPELEERLQAVWQQLGHLIDWCDSAAAWMQLFCAEARPYRETFYWETVARMMSDYLAAHAAASPQEALTDCLIATQCPPCSDDQAALAEFHTMWQAILRSSQEAIGESMQRDLALARAEGTYDAVTALYAADRQKWQCG